VPATGTYRVTVSYVAGEVARTSTMTMSEGGTVTITFAAGTGCCATTTVDIVLVAGTNQITLANPTGPVPLIDRLLVGTP
jgi:diaminopimelate epimerase